MWPLGNFPFLLLLPSPCRRLRGFSEIFIRRACCPDPNQATEMTFKSQASVVGTGVSQFFSLTVDCLAEARHHFDLECRLCCLHHDPFVMVKVKTWKFCLSYNNLVLLLCVWNYLKLSQKDRFRFNGHRECRKGGITDIRRCSLIWFHCGWV